MDTPVSCGASWSMIGMPDGLGDARVVRHERVGTGFDEVRRQHHQGVGAERRGAAGAVDGRLLAGTIRGGDDRHAAVDAADGGGDDRIALGFGELVPLAGDGDAGDAAGSLGQHPVDLALEALQIERPVVGKRGDQDRDAAVKSSRVAHLANSRQAVSSLAATSGRAPSRRSQPGEKRGRKFVTW